ncbi:T9SS type A sorting domain-containing protein [Flavobacterium sp.]|uniref:T9SS type A sorting domain-containing protein n=1 Tax=Flavobacterium sp. TaxID=239 RepID=UPI003752AC7D
MKFKQFAVILSFLLVQNINSQSQFINTNFGTNGYTCVNQPIGSYVFGDLINVNDDFYAFTSFSNYSIIKFDTNGDIVPSFGTNGIRSLNLYSGGGELNDNSNSFIRKTPNNEFLMVVDNYSSVFPGNFIAKTDINGNLINSFGVNGYVNNSFLSESIDFHSVEIINNEIILIGNNNSYTSSNPNKYIIIIKLDLNGNLISSFGNNGILKFNYNYLEYDTYFSVFDSNHNAVYTLFKKINSGNQHYITKFNLNNNSVDTNFGINGKLFIDNINNSSYYISPDVFCLDDYENIYVSGSFNYNASTLDYYMFTSKYNNTQQPDATFGNQGMFLTKIESGNSSPKMYSIKKSLNEVTLTGTTYQWGNYSFEKSFLLKLNDDGTLKQDFGLGGKIINYLFTSGNHPYKTIEQNGMFTIATNSRACINDNKPTIIQINSNNSLSINDNSHSNDFILSPNPVKDYMFCKGNEDVVKIEIIDIYGRILKSIYINDNKVDLSEFKTGNYILKLHTKSKIVNTMIIKE